jgi:hypothetical protein
MLFFTYLANIHLKSHQYTLNTVFACVQALSPYFPTVGSEEEEEDGFDRNAGAAQKAQELQEQQEALMKRKQESTAVKRSELIKGEEERTEGKNESEEESREESREESKEEKEGNEDKEEREQSKEEETEEREGKEGEVKSKEEKTDNLATEKADKKAAKKKAKEAEKVGKRKAKQAEKGKEKISGDDPASLMPQSEGKNVDVPAAQEVVVKVKEGKKQKKLGKKTAEKVEKKQKKLIEKTVEPTVTTTTTTTTTAATGTRTDSGKSKATPVEQITIPTTIVDPKTDSERSKGKTMEPAPISTTTATATITAVEKNSKTKTAMTKKEKETEKETKADDAKLDVKVAVPKLAIKQSGEESGSAALAAMMLPGAGAQRSVAVDDNEHEEKMEAEDVQKKEKVVEGRKANEDEEEEEQVTGHEEGENAATLDAISRSMSTDADDVSSPSMSDSDSDTSDASSDNKSEQSGSSPGASHSSSISTAPSHSQAQSRSHSTASAVVVKSRSNSVASAAADVFRRVSLPFVTTATITDAATRVASQPGKSYPPRPAQSSSSPTSSPQKQRAVAPRKVGLIQNLENVDSFVYGDKSAPGGVPARSDPSNVDVHSESRAEGVRGVSIPKEVRERDSNSSPRAQRVLSDKSHNSSHVNSSVVEIPQSPVQEIKAAGTEHRTKERAVTLTTLQEPSRAEIEELPAVGVVTAEMPSDFAEPALPLVTAPAPVEEVVTITTTASAPSREAIAFAQPASISPVAVVAPSIPSLPSPVPTPIPVTSEIPAAPRVASHTMTSAGSTPMSPIPISSIPSTADSLSSSPAPAELRARVPPPIHIASASATAIASPTTITSPQVTLSAKLPALAGTDLSATAQPSTLAGTKTKLSASETSEALSKNVPIQPASSATVQTLGLAVATASSEMPEAISQDDADQAEEDSAQRLREAMQKHGEAARGETQNELEARRAKSERLWLERQNNLLLSMATGQRGVPAVPYTPDSEDYSTTLPLLTTKASDPIIMEEPSVPRSTRDLGELDADTTPRLRPSPRRSPYNSDSDGGGSPRVSPRRPPRRGNSSNAFAPDLQPAGIKVHTFWEQQVFKLVTLFIARTPYSCENSVTPL